MRKLALMVILLVLSGSALAERAVEDGADRAAVQDDGASSLDALEAALDEAGFDAFAEASKAAGGDDARGILRSILSGKSIWDEAQLDALLKDLVASVRQAFLEVLAALAAPVLAGAILRALLDGREGSGAAALLCRLSCASLLTVRYVRWSGLASDLLSRTAGLTDAVMPVLAVAMSLTGSGLESMLTPISAVLGKLTQNVLIGAAMPLCGIAAGVACAANLSDRFQLNQLFTLLKRMIASGVRLLIAAFVGMLAMEGLLASGQDAPLLRTMQRAVRGVMPIIGQQASDSLSMVSSSARAVVNAVGVTGMTVILSACAKPMLGLVVSSLSMQLAAAVLEPVADTGVVRIIVHFSELSRMLLAICIGCAILSVLFIGACFSLAFTGTL